MVGHGHNSGDASFSAEAEVPTAAAQGRLKSFIERLEQLNEDRAASNRGGLVVTREQRIDAVVREAYRDDLEEFGWPTVEWSMRNDVCGEVNSDYLEHWIMPRVSRIWAAQEASGAQ